MTDPTLSHSILLFAGAAAAATLRIPGGAGPAAPEGLK
jgi:hypothetical protein